MSDPVRVFRLLEYVGPREAVEAQLARSIHGTRFLGSGDSIAITAHTISEFPEKLEASRLTVATALVSELSSELRESTKQRGNLEALLEDAQAEIAKLKESKEQTGKEQAGKEHESKS